MVQTGSRLVLLLVLGLGLAGCDKCGDWFWVDPATPHACKEAPPAR